MLQREKMKTEKLKEIALKVKDSMYDTDDNEVFFARFAEIIVRDCALTAGLMEHEGRKGIGAQILDNFGVEK